MSMLTEYSHMDFIYKNNISLPVLPLILDCTQMGSIISPFGNMGDIWTPREHAMLVEYSCIWASDVLDVGEGQGV